jgi:nitrate/TMAO reductase-like tetraheme cytochrome c subunit
MGTIVCLDCHKVIEHYNEEKVTTLYSTCSTCNKNRRSK